MLPRALALLAVAAMLLPSVQAGNDALLTDYTLLPTEHDDQGRSDEPDGVSTSVLGPLLSNCILSFAPLATPGLGRACVPDGTLGPGVLAPGCTDDAGRQPSGTCGLWSQGVRAATNPDGSLTYAVPPQTAGTRGMGNQRAPGAFTPTKDSTVRFLDIRAGTLPINGFYTSGARVVDVDHKLADLPVSLRGAGLGPSLIGPTAFWAWYGLWKDANGNGVIDALGDDAGHGFAANEFTWVGACAGPAESSVCRAEAGLRMPLWIWPGDHHQGCGVPIGCLVPSDYPGAQAVCFVAVLTPGAGPNSVVLRCDAQEDLDASQAQADPLLGPATSVRPDLEMADTTGAKEVAERQWRGASSSGSAPPAYFYDQSLLSTTLLVGGPTLGSGAGSAANGFDTSLLQFVDVDRSTAPSPLLEGLVAGTVKPLVRGEWTLVRDDFVPATNTVDSLLNHAAIDASPTLGPVQQRVLDPGWPREPNTALDAQPGAVWHAFAPSGPLSASEQDFRGWLNSYANYAAGWHAFADVQAHRVEFAYGAVHTPVGQVGASGGVVADSLDPLLLRSDGDHTRALEPGAYQVRGFVGAWRDAANRMDERTLDLPASAAAGTLVVARDAYALPADGWVGNLVNTTGGFRSRGYADTTCTIGGASAMRAYSVCHPYLDEQTARADAAQGAGQGAGIALADPQDPTSGELLAPAPPAQPYTFALTPEGGTWTFPVLVWRDFFDQAAGVPVVEIASGTTGPITLRSMPGTDPSRPASRDLLLLPIGAPCAIRTQFDARVRVVAPAVGANVDEAVRDVDLYAPWQGPC